MPAPAVATSADGATQGADTDGLERHDGNITVTEDGATIDGLYVNGAIYVRADNVTIQNSVVAYRGYHSIRIFPGADGTRILNTTVDCPTSHTNGVVFGNYYAENVALQGCRHDFMFSEDNPAQVVNSTVDGVPFETGEDATEGQSPLPEPSTKPTPDPEPSTEPTSDPEPTPDPEPSAEPTDPEPSAEPTDPEPSSEPTDPEPSSEPTDPEPSTDPPQAVSGNFPTVSSTGPRSSSQQSRGALTTSRDGQVIERTTINGRLTIQNDNVTVRDVTVNGTGTYMIYIVATPDGTCPTNVRIQYTEINGKNAPATAIPLYAPECGFTFDHGLIQNIGRGLRLANNATISNSYIYLTKTWDGAHRAGISTHGGRNVTVTNNVIMCENTGCSAAVTMYGDYAPVNGYLLQRNLIATTGSYCVYGGSVSSKSYPNGSNVRIIDNHFSTRYFDTCGRYGAVTSFDNGSRGNVFSGNVWHETGERVTY